MDNNEQILKELKKQTMWKRIQTFFTVLILACLVWLSLSISKLVPLVAETVESSRAVIESSQELIETSLDVLQDIDDMMPNMQSAVEELESISKSFNEEGLKSLYESLEKLNKIDINKLNESIQGLSSVVSPLARLFGR